MAQVTYRANLSAAIFPLSLAQAGRSVIIPGPDNNYDRRVDPEGEQKDAGIPQAIYLENVIPTANGYQSVGYETLGSITLPTGHLYFYRVAVLNGYTYIFEVNSGGTPNRCYRSNDLITWTDATATWFAVFGAPFIEGYLPYNNMSQATIRGVTYVYVRNGQVLGTVVGTALTDISGTITGIAATDIQCIVGSFNYLIAILDDGSIAWSSTTTPTDFTPSLVTGAGSATPNAIRSEIVAAHVCPEGFILYTRENAVLAQYTGNSRYPWKFTEISNSGGHTSERLIAAPQDSAVHFTINAQGSINQISASGAVRVAPEVSTYLRTGLGAYDVYNSSTNTIDTTNAYLFAYEIMYLANRYICVQLTSENGANGIVPCATIIYDTLLRRYGRLGSDALFLWDDSENVYCLTTAGAIKQIVYDVYDSTTAQDGILVLGKFQYVRSRRLSLEEMVIEGDFNGVTPYVISSDDGNPPASGDAMDLAAGTNYVRSYTCRNEGVNHAIAIKGKFSLSTVELVMHIGGSR